LACMIKIHYFLEEPTRVGDTVLEACLSEVDGWEIDRAGADRRCACEERA
jgi:hypothetical protein